VVGRHVRQSVGKLEIATVFPQSGDRGYAVSSSKKADVAEPPERFSHVGLLFNHPPGLAGGFFNESSEFEFNHPTKPITDRHGLHDA